MKIMKIMFPIFNWGQALMLSPILIILTFGAIFIDGMLTLYMGLLVYFSIVINSFLRGLAPDEAEIEEYEIGPITAILARERFVYPIQERVWAPALSRSRLFKSDWISISETGENKFILRARKRDLQIILSDLRSSHSEDRNDREGLSRAR